MAPARTAITIQSPHSSASPSPQSGRTACSLRIAPASTRLSVVIVNFCQWKNTLRLTRQLRRAESATLGSAEVVIVDNHSPGHRAIGELRRSVGISLRRFGRNRGFARGVNEGVRLSRGSWILLLNPDMSVSKEFLDRALERADRLDITDPKTGIVGFGLRHSDGSRQASCGPIPTLWNTLAGLFVPRSRRKCRLSDSLDPGEVAWATGCCLLIRREVLEELGGFSQAFFLYYEDVDFCLRARRNGWKVLFDPTLELVHHTPLHRRRVHPAMRLITRHALLTFACAHWRRSHALGLAGVMWVESWVRQFASLFSARTDEARTHASLRRMLVEVVGGRERAIRQRIREAAAMLGSASAAQDGRTT